MITRREFLAASGGGVALSNIGVVPSAFGEPPLKIARILTGFAPGLTDSVGRVVADQTKDYAGSIVVETRPGASGRIAVEVVKAAPSDGSVMLLAPLGFATLFPHVYKTLAYGPQDFIPVTTVASFPTVLVVGPKVPREQRSLSDFVAWCRANPKDATYGTAGIGTTLHFIGAMLGRNAGFEFLHVPYQGRQAVDDVHKGAIAAAIMPLGSCLGLVQSGDLRALATTGPRRSTFLPDVPTMAEAGYPLLEDVTWFGLFLPAKTPAPVIERLNHGIQAALTTDKVRSGMRKLFVEVDAIALDDFARLIASESERWKGIVQATGFSPEDSGLSIR